MSFVARRLETTNGVLRFSWCVHTYTEELSIWEMTMLRSNHRFLAVTVANAIRYVRTVYGLVRHVSAPGDSARRSLISP